MSFITTAGQVISQLLVIHFAQGMTKLYSSTITHPEGTVHASAVDDASGQKRLDNGYLVVMLDGKYWHRSV